MTRITLIAALILASCNGSSSSQSAPDANSSTDGNGSTDAGVDGGLDGSGANVSTCPGNTYPGTAICGNAHWTWDRPTPTGVSLHGIWTFATNDVWIAGGEGTILHYDGASWAVEQTPV